MFPRKPPLPSFWRSAQWNEWLPAPLNQTEQEGLPKLPVFEEARAIIAALDPHEYNAPPVSLAKAVGAAKALDEWFERVMPELTWPPSVESFVRAAKPLFAPTATEQDRMVLGLLDAFRPDLIAATRLEVDLRETWLAEATKSVIRAPKVVTEAGPLSPMASELTGWITALRSRGDIPSTVLKEELDGRIKNSIITTKGAGQRSKNYWFEDLLWPALCELPLEDLTDLKRFWPDHQEFTFNDPVRAIDSRPFWQGLRNMQQPARRFLMDEFLPSLVNGSSWQPEQRLAMLDPLLSRVKEHPGIIKERLALWTAWGGDLDMPVHLPMEEGALTAPRTTAREWMTQNRIDPDATPSPRPRKNKGPR